MSGKKAKASGNEDGEVRVFERFLVFLMLPPTHARASLSFAAIRHLITCQSLRCYSFGMLLH